MRAELNVVNAVNGLLEVARQFGGSNLPRVGDASAEQLQRAVRASSFELYSGEDDRLLRRLAMDVDIGFEVSEPLRQALGELVGARITFELSVTDPNEPVSVREPAGALPYSELG